MIQTVSKPTVELIKHNGADEDVAHAAWVSNFASEARNRPVDRIAGLINFLYREKHMSPFEHGSFTFFIDTHIAVAREFMRHRTFSYNETSGRYKTMEGRFYVPPPIRPLVKDPGSKIGAYKFVDGTHSQYAIMRACHEHAFETCWDMYQAQLDAGIANEVARGVLPLNLYTQFYATANPRNIMQFLTLRNEDQALWEIQAVAEAVEEAFADAMPLTYRAFTAERDTFRRIKAILEEFDIDTLERLVGGYRQEKELSGKEY